MGTSEGFVTWVKGVKMVPTPDLKQADGRADESDKAAVAIRTSRTSKGSQSSCKSQLSNKFVKSA